MRHLLLAICASMAIAGLCIAGAVEEPTNPPPAGLILTPGTYPTKWIIPEAERSVVHRIGGHGECLETAPSSLKKAPPFISSKPLYGRITFREAQPWIYALDESAGTGKGYDTLYLDLNGNGDLTDDPKAMGTIMHRGSEWDKLISVTPFVSVATLPLTTWYPSGNDENAVAVDATYLREGDERILLTSLRGAWEGEIDSNQGKIPFRLIDFDMNWSYNDRFPPDSDTTWEHAFDGDSVWFDWNHTGVFPLQQQALRAARDSTLLTQLRAVNSIAGKLYLITPSRDGRELKIENYDGPRARVALKAAKLGKVQLAIRRAILSGKFGNYSIPVDGQSTDVPAGKYSLFVRCEQRYNNKFYRVDYANTKAFAQSARVSTVTIGDASMRLKIVGCNNHHVLLSKDWFSPTKARLVLRDGATVTMRGDSLEPPAILLKDLQGKVAGRSRGTNWENGWWVYCDPASRLLNNLKPGRYTLEVRFDSGPFGGTLTACKPAILEKPKTKR